MSEYNPDSWVVFKITGVEEKDFYKVLAGWSGGYLDGDSWRINSGIVKVEDDGDYWNFIGDSGSVYRCHKQGEAMRMSMAPTWERLTAKFPANVALVSVAEVITFLGDCK